MGWGKVLPYQASFRNLVACRTKCQLLVCLPVKVAQGVDDAADGANRNGGYKTGKRSRKLKQKSLSAVFRTARKPLVYMRR